MKFFAVFLTVVSAVGVNSVAEARDYVKTNYVVSATYANPLGTFDNCSEYTWTGIKAFSQAEDEAQLQCQSDDNVACVTVGAQYITRSSAVFPGYKTCTAKVTVQGFGPK